MLDYRTMSPHHPEPMSLGRLIDAAVSAALADAAQTTALAGIERARLEISIHQRELRRHRRALATAERSQAAAERPAQGQVPTHRPRLRANGAGSYPHQ